MSCCAQSQLETALEWESGAKQGRAVRIDFGANKSLSLTMPRYLFSTGANRYTSILGQRVFLSKSDSSLRPAE